MTQRQLFNSIFSGNCGYVPSVPIAKTGFAASYFKKDWLDNISYRMKTDALLAVGALPSVVVGEQEYFSKGHALAFDFSLIRESADKKVYACDVPTAKGALHFERTYIRGQYPALTFSLTDNDDYFNKICAYITEVANNSADIVKTVKSVRSEVGEDAVIQFFLPQPFEMYCLAGREQAIYLMYDGDSEFKEFKKLALKVNLELIKVLGACGLVDMFFIGSSGSELYSPDIICEEFLPASEIMINAIRAAGGRSTYHACGNMRAIFEQTNILALRPDVMEGIAYAPLGDLMQKNTQAIDRSIVLRGNIDLGLLHGGTPESVYNAATEFIAAHPNHKIMLSGTCDVLYKTPKANMLALAEAGKNAKK